MAKELIFFLVDDDPDDSFLFGEVLREIDATIRLHTAVDGREALDKLSVFDPLPHVIFLDLNMPRMGGLECLTALKADVRLSGVPVILYTTSSHSKDIEASMQRGAACFITKPTNVKELTSILMAITQSLPYHLDSALRTLSKGGHHFIIC